MASAAGQFFIVRLPKRSRSSAASLRTTLTGPLARPFQAFSGRKMSHTLGGIAERIRNIDEANAQKTSSRRPKRPGRQNRLVKQELHHSPLVQSPASEITPKEPDAGGCRARLNRYNCAGVVRR
jgi:hypothetical protein